MITVCNARLVSSYCISSLYQAYQSIHFRYCIGDQRLANATTKVFDPEVFSARRSPRSSFCHTTIRAKQCVRFVRHCSGHHPLVNSLRQGFAEI
jgi:hypothetical protein